MAKAFSVASWNVEHFGATDRNTKRPKKPIEPIIEFLAAQKADLVALYEVESSVVFQPIVDAMPGYQFYITEGPQTQEILVGIKNGFSGFVTQKLQFKSSQPGLRPGVLVTLTIDQEYYPILFLHLKSMPDPKGFGLRDDMLQLALKFRRTLDRSGTDHANYLFVGDLNTMGLDYPYAGHDISAVDELNELSRRARHPSKRMRLLAKTNEFTFFNGTHSAYPESNLDHVVAADHLQFKAFGDCEVDVRGWPQADDPDQWIQTYSDHALLYFEVQKVSRVA
ncbi:MAG: endonuclease/exonuclease/phosphatase family protein [Planctomycetales bacterium]|nr:endonuclease/exonuclease/phosphatase family protein [Planctomycetales bacterium]